MTTSEISKPSGDGRGFFSIYKPGQGKFVRWSTVSAIALLTALSMYWAFGFVRWIAEVPTTNQTAAVTTKAAVQGSDRYDMIAWIIVAILGVVGALLAFMAANRPRSAEFMIMTESEMRKVTWPSRQTVINSTKIVIVLTLVLATILAGVDAAFMYLFRWIEIL